METGNLDHGEDAANNQRRRDEVVPLGRLQIDTAGATENQWRRNNTSQHSERTGILLLQSLRNIRRKVFILLKSEQESQENGHAVIEAEERTRVVGLRQEGNIGLSRLALSSPA